MHSDNQISGRYLFRNICAFLDTTTGAGHRCLSILCDREIHATGRRFLYFELAFNWWFVKLLIEKHQLQHHVPDYNNNEFNYSVACSKIFI